MPMFTDIPPALVEAVETFRREERAPVVPRDASSVILLRDGASRPEVYLLRRTTSMAFAAGFCVFPGGGVDPRDFDTEIGWAGPTADSWADTLGCDLPTARALVCAAVRETFEESGVLLAGPSATTVVADTTSNAWEADRRALESRELSLSDLLARRGLLLRSDLLRFWAHWVTPLWEPKRFDTRFFVAVLPDGQATRDVSTESDQVSWIEVAEARDQVDRGELAMLPPTYVNTSDLAPFADLAEVVAEADGRLPEVVRPDLVIAADGTAHLSIGR
ncbi:NUDIX domain-containing protein [Nocardioides sp.]|uniref:NUDIX hydrolase n=1 Tax=Nocardioides sp. TaxID=35761 RepID=UPI00262AE273|nr:NUDIX domain-containing protein [Nocardioides sp.]